jgi:hypothetical protein
MEAYGSNEAGLEACVEDLCAAWKTTSRRVNLVIQAAIASRTANVVSH